MTVVIIAQPNKFLYATCDGCMCKLQYVPNDIQHRDYKDYGGGSDRYYYITCPGCNRRVSLDSRNIPSSAQ